MDLQDVLKSIADNNIKYVRLEISDQYGIARCRTIPSRHFEQKATLGQNFVLLAFMSIDPVGNFISDTGYLHEVNCGDTLCFPDYDTFAILPWCKDTARILLNPTLHGKPLMGPPREVAKKQYNRLKELGYSLLAAHEHDFLLLDQDTQEPAFKTNHWNSTVRSSYNTAFTQQVEHDLLIAGVDVEGIENECRPGKVEMSYKPAFGLRAADNAHTYKTGIKEIARQHNYIARFMTKPYPDDVVGNKAHLNHSLWDADGKVGLFYDEASPTGLSSIAQHWMAGILAHAPAITLLHAPTINCITCLQPDSWYPINATWGLDNRTCLLRAKVAGPDGTYIEDRLGCAGGSPYLSLAGIIIAGIDGIQRQLPLPKPVNGSAYNEKNLPPGVPPLPNNMKDALDAFLQDKVITEALGDDFVKAFAVSKMHEMQLEEVAKTKGDTKWEENFYSYL